MNCILNKRLWVLATAVFLVGCGQYETDRIPDFEPRGNMVALLWTDSVMQFDVAVTGPQLDRVRDPARLRSVLYENGMPVDTFALSSDYTIQWGQTYQIETLIDGQYRVRSEPHPISDSLAITFLRREVREDRRDRFFYRIKAPDQLPEDSVYYKFDGNRRQLAPGAADTIFVTAKGNRANLRVFHYSKAYVIAEREQTMPGGSNDFRPGFINFTNMEEGVGLISFIHLYEKRSP